MRLWTVLPMLALALGACSGMDAAECRTADWRAVGFEDGAQGRSPQYFGERRKACSEYGVAANFNAYSAGRTEGLRHFCHPYNGYRLGTKGYRYAGICPAELEPAFLTAHADGYGLYERHATLSRIGKALQRSRARGREIETSLAEKSMLLVSPQLDVSRRATIAIEIKQLTDEMVEVETSITHLERDHAEAEREYDRYRNSIAARPTN